MLTRNAIGGAIAVAALGALLSGTQANAQNFTYSTSYASTSIVSGTSTLTILPTTAGPVGATTFITLSNLSLNTTPGTGPNHFNDPYSATITIHDVASGGNITKSFSGSFVGDADGGVGGNAPSTSVTDVFSTPALTFSFADGTYTLNRTFTTPPGATGSLGTQGAIVTFTPNRLTTPEPGSVVAFLAGGSILALLAFRRRTSFTPTA
ncbi:hypothetical protein CCAX7_001080 [Capsulimonas corticalis]|uniref:Uncharacterized protein n=1 Tax=Capsulimonas corticalis TaxID=2219043 RepID=A0A402CRI9_9BACT|nr:PEP-CTERM sorting domain-containing protein [Capsulimonas corticalis]BDI28057.1 hypothetical protein CCAX7_001080 [Capsulimonas corticalis]